MKKIKIKMEIERTEKEINNIPFFLEPVIIKTVDDEYPPIYKVYIYFEKICSEHTMNVYISNLFALREKNLEKYITIENIPDAFRFILNTSQIHIDKIFYSKEEFENFKIEKPDNVTDEVWESVLWDIKNRDYAEFHYSNFTGFSKKEY